MLLPHVHIPFPKVPEYLEFINKHQPNLEVYFSSVILDNVTHDNLEDFRNSLNYSPSLTLHAPFMDLSPGAVDQAVHQVTMDRFFQILDVAGTLKPLAIVFHSGYEKWKYALNVDIWLENSIKTWQPVKEKASALGVKIAIENIFEDEPHNLKLLMEQMRSENFGICFDTGHCNLFSKVSLKEWMDALNPYILEVHLHDNERKSDEHLTPGKGSFDFDLFFKLLSNKSCIYTIEAHSPEGVLESIEAVKQFTLTT